MTPTREQVFKDIAPLLRRLLDEDPGEPVEDEQEDAA